jgi:hypothetical protein
MPEHTARDAAELVGAVQSAGLPDATIGTENMDIGAPVEVSNLSPADESAREPAMMEEVQITEVLHVALSQEQPVEVDPVVESPSQKEWQRVIFCLRNAIYLYIIRVITYRHSSGVENPGPSEIACYQGWW